MTVRPILPIDHPLLRKTARPVVHFGPALRRLVDDMFDTLREANGVGLAGPQVGQSIRLFVAQYEDQRIALSNPVITHREGESIGIEGCLSLPGFVGVGIRRAARIDVEGLDPRSERVTLTAEGIFARILQHEIDHLNGILFLDHLNDVRDLRVIRTDEAGGADTPEPVAAGPGS